MKMTPGMTAAALLAMALGVTTAYAQETPAPAPAAENTSAVATQDDAPVSHNSKVRIVRLSEVKGVVQLDRATGVGYEAAMVNLPIIEKSRLRTTDGVAEIEFEDNSTLRVTTDSEVEFPRLEMLPTGAQASTIRVLKGTVYVSLVNTKGADFAVTFGEQKLLLRPSTHLRLELGKGEAQLAMFDGGGQVQSASGATTELQKKRTFTFNMASPSEPVMAKNVAEEPLDAWDQNASEYHKRFANAAFGGSGYSYGGSDMAYYGSFMNASGCGQMWRPYLASAAWDPYANGTWALYQNSGYSWVSPYPWGWTPFHTGSWSYCNGTGWGWMPGGSWNGLNNMPSSSSPTLGTSGHRPTPPRHVLIGTQPTLVPVNTRPLTHSTLTGGDTFTFRNDSAGLGIPRGTLGKLNKVSQEASQRGFATTPVTLYTPSADRNPATGGIGGGTAGRGAPVGRSTIATGGSRSGGASSGSHPSGSSAPSSGSSGASHSPSFSGGSMGAGSSGGMSGGSHGGGGGGGSSRTH